MDERESTLEMREKDEWGEKIVENDERWSNYERGLTYSNLELMVKLEWINKSIS